MPSPGARTRWLSLGLLAGVAVSAAALAAVFYKVDWSALGAVLARVEPLYLALPAVLVLGNVLCRAARWRVMLAPLHRFRLIRDMLSVYLIGYMASMLLPLKAGDLLRPVLISGRGQVGLAAVLPSVVAEKLIDLLYMLLMLVVSLGLMPVPPAVQRSGILLAGLSVAALVVAWLVLMAGRGAGVRARLTGWLPARAAGFLDRQLVQAASGVAVMRRPGTAAWVVGYTALFWTITFSTLHIYLALLRIQAPWYAPLFVIMVVNLGKALPSSPGAIGVAHAMYVVALAAFGVPREEALAFAIIAHGLGYVAVVAGGVLFLWLEGMTLATIWGARPGKS